MIKLVRTRSLFVHVLLSISLTLTMQAIQGAKAKSEQEMNTLGHDLDEMAAEARMSEEKAQRAMVDAARLADELRAEQEMAMAIERDRKLLEAQVLNGLSEWELHKYIL